MQFERKLKNKTWENGKKPSFRPNFDPFDPNLGFKNFYDRFYLYYLLDIIASYHCEEF